jgi:amidase
MARTVKDAAYILQAIAGSDAYDNYTSAIPNNGSLPDYVAACKLDALQGKRIGIPRNAIGPRTNTTAPILDAFEASLATLEQAGAIIVDNTNYTAWEDYIQSDAEEIILEVDFVANLKAYLAQLTYNPTGVMSLADVDNFTKTFPLEDYPDRNTDTWDSALMRNFTNDSPELWASYQKDLYFGGIGGLLGAIQNNSLDAVVLPTAFSPGISAIIGGPVVTVPLGATPRNTTWVPNGRNDLLADGPNAPFGLSFAGKLWSEESLIGFAYAFEQRTMVREKVKPYVMPKTELADVVG